MDIYGNAGLHGDDARYLPATKRGLHERARIVTEHRDVVNEVDGGVMCAIEAAGPDIIFPSKVWIRDLGQVSAAGSPRISSRVNCARISVKRAQIKVAANLGVQVHLQTVVMGVGLI